MLWAGKMDLIIILPHRFECYGDIRANSFYSEAKKLFDKIILVLRIKEVGHNRKNILVNIRENVYVYPIPYYVGLKLFIKKSPLIIISLIRLILKYKNTARYLIRGGDITGILMAMFLNILNIPYAFSIIGDPDLVYTTENLGIKHVRLLRCFFVKGQRYLAKKAKVVSYVTKDYLQRKYPPSEDTIIYCFSDVFIPKKYILGEPRTYNNKTSNYWILLFVGSLEQKYKGLHVLMEALKICKTKGIEFKLLVAGDGKYKAEYTELMIELGLSSDIEFLGYIGDFEGIINVLDQSDIFILPSLTEGLPRALIEAMARGLPCIGTNVGGVPELLAKEDIVEPGDRSELANKIIEIVGNRERLNGMSARNLLRAMYYSNERLSSIRREFYKVIMDM